jgi:hypothetical protein
VVAGANSESRAEASDIEDELEEEAEPEDNRPVKPHIMEWYKLAHVVPQQF